MHKFECDVGGRHFVVHYEKSGPAQLRVGRRTTLIPREMAYALEQLSPAALEDLFITVSRARRELTLLTNRLVSYGLSLTAANQLAGDVLRLN